VQSYKSMGERGGVKRLETPREGNQRPGLGGERGFVVNKQEHRETKIESPNKREAV